MKNFFYPAIVLIFLTGCSTPSTVKNNADSVNSTNANLPTVNQPVTNVETQAETNRVKMQDTMSIGGREKRIDEKKGGIAEPIEATPYSNPAPDNSEIVSTMNKQMVPVETRTFKNNPLLVKIEKTFEDAKNPKTKVYLKNGKVLNLPSGKIDNPSTASANEILNAVGAIPKAPPQTSDSKKETEKKYDN